MQKGPLHPASQCPPQWHCHSHPWAKDPNLASRRLASGSRMRPHNPDPDHRVSFGETWGHHRDGDSYSTASLSQTAAHELYRSFGCHSLQAFRFHTFCVCQYCSCFLSSFSSLHGLSCWFYSRSGGVNMVISCINSFFNGFLLGRFILPGPESDCRDVGTSVELESCRHFSYL